MGRTVPSFKISAIIERAEWKEFRKCLKRDDIKTFDEVFDISLMYNYSCTMAVNPVRIRPIMMSIIFHHYKQLTQIESVTKEVIAKKAVAMEARVSLDDFV